MGPGSSQGCRPVVFRCYLALIHGHKTAFTITRFVPGCQKPSLRAIAEGRFQGLFLQCQNSRIFPSPRPPHGENPEKVPQIGRLRDRAMIMETSQVSPKAETIYCCQFSIKNRG